MDTTEKVVLEVEGVNAVLVYLGTRPWSEVNALIVGLQQNSQLFPEACQPVKASAWDKGYDAGFEAAEDSC